MEQFTEEYHAHQGVDHSSRVSVDVCPVERPRGSGSALCPAAVAQCVDSLIILSLTVGRGREVSDSVRDSSWRRRWSQHEEGYLCESFTHLERSSKSGVRNIDAREGELNLRLALVQQATQGGRFIALFRG